LVNEAVDKYFSCKSLLLKKLETEKVSLQNNAKIVIPSGTGLVNVIGKLAGVLPLNIKRENKKCTKNCKSNIPSSCY